MNKTIAKPKASPLSYIESVAWSLWDGFSDYGFFHADPWYVGAAANPNEEMAFDKARYEKATEVKRQAAHVACRRGLHFGAWSAQKQRGLCHPGRGLSLGGRPYPVRLQPITLSQPGEALHPFPQSHGMAACSPG